jgi:hypothetical protein
MQYGGRFLLKSFHWGSILKMKSKAPGRDEELPAFIIHPASGHQPIQNFFSLARPQKIAADRSTGRLFSHEAK